MHGTGLWLGAFVAHLAGGAVVTLTSRSLDAHEVLRTVERNRALLIVIVGDAFAKPLHPGDRRGGRARRAVRPVVARS